MPYKKELSGKYLQKRPENDLVSSGNFFRLKSTWKSTSNIVEICGNLNSSNIFQIPCDKTRGIFGVDPQNLI
jgi:hypothetical protein